jgi:small-conductance mechanosensitive channel/CRP-like cAMP-binding protein
VVPALLPAASFLGLDLSREQAVELAGAVALGTALLLALVRLARWLRRRGGHGAGIALFAAFVYVPLLVGYLSLGILEVTAGVLNPAEVGLGKQPVVGPLLPARVLLFLVVILGIYFGTWLLDAWLFTKAREEEMGVRVPRILRDSVRWAILLVSSLLVAGVVFRFDLEKLAILGGALSIALSLALGPTLGSLISGITLISERPFEIGDWIEVDGRQGRVDQITWRSTRIVTRDRQVVVIPNALLAAERFLNLSRPDPVLGIRLRVPVHLRTPPLDVREVLRDAVLSAPGVRSSPEPALRISEFGEVGAVWEIRFWIDEPGPAEDVRGEVMQRLWHALDRAGIEIPLPSRNLVERDASWAGRPSPTREQEEEHRSRVLSLLRTAPVFGPLAEEALARLAASARDERYLAGERVTRQGDAGDRMYFILDGKARVSLEDAGMQEVDVLGPGQFFGEMALLTGAPRTASVFAVTPLRLAAVRAEHLGVILREHPEFAETMARFAAERRIRLQDLTARARPDSAGAGLQDTSTSLLGEIARFFRLPRIRGGGGDGGSR